MVVLTLWGESFGEVWKVDKNLPRPKPQLHVIGISQP